MTKTPTIMQRLTELEHFMDALTRDSHFVKASIEGEIFLDSVVTGDDRAIAQRTAEHDRQQALERRVKRLERRTATTKQAEGERVLAKAAGGYSSGDDILRAAQKDPAIGSLKMGVIQGYVSQGRVREARSILLEAQEGRAVAKADDLASNVMNAVGADTTEDAGEVRDAVVRLEQALSSITQRLDRLETRAPSATVQSAARTVAKAAPGKLSTGQLLDMISAYVDSSTRAGELSSMVQSGDPQQVQRATDLLLGLKRSHESQRAREERRGWGQ